MRKFENLKTMKPKVSSDWNKLGPYSKHIFDNPIMENFITTYMEETQD